MKERPILFSGPMVRAILDGSKTQTRRIVKGPAQGAMNRDDPREEEDGGALWILQCPFGQPGDRLWVRETHIIDDISQSVFYRATETFSFVGPWRPSIHMPRWASRITLEIVSVRVERLQEVSKEDAIAEGLEWISPTWGIKGIAESWNLNPRDTYRALWNAINGYESWGNNPWVWVIEFKRVNPC